VKAATHRSAATQGFSSYSEAVRLTRLLRELTIAKDDGQYAKLLTNLAEVDVLILDDWWLMKLSEENRRDLLEVLEDRRSTIATRVIPPIKSGDQK